MAGSDLPTDNIVGEELKLGFGIAFLQKLDVVQGIDHNLFCHLSALVDAVRFSDYRNSLVNQLLVLGVHFQNLFQPFRVCWLAVHQAVNHNQRHLALLKQTQKKIKEAENILLSQNQLFE